MISEVIHLTTSESFQKEAPTNQSERIVDAFLESCKALDASIFEPFMEEENVFQNKNKYLFLASMKALFDSYMDNKALFFNVTVVDGTCKGCKYGKAIKAFSVKGWGRTIFNDKFAYVIEMEKGILKDIFRCNYFSSKLEREEYL